MVPGTVRAVLAYVFFRRRASDVERDRYEEALASFHATLPTVSAAFRLAALPFGDQGPGYEDWYLVPDWAELGRLGDLVLQTSRRAEHDTVAGLAGEGWGGVYALQRGIRRPPIGLRWASKPVGTSYEQFLAELGEETVWQRQLVLGPAPEFALEVGPDEARTKVA